MRPLPRSFYDRDTVIVARQLLGKVLVRRVFGEILSGRIVEVEAYRGSDDPASHAHRGLTNRNRVMFGEPGHAYVYFTYGMHYCLNVTTEPAGQPGAVLLRAVQPLKGIQAMSERRGTRDPINISDGPAKLTQAFAITKHLNGHDLTSGRILFITAPDSLDRFTTAATPRIGIRTGTDKPWRFLIQDSPFVSG